MMMTEMEMMKLQNGSDVRGVAVAGVPGEEVTLTPETGLLLRSFPFLPKN